MDLGAGLENRKGRQWWGGSGGTEEEESLNLSLNPVCHLLAGDSVSQSIKCGVIILPLSISLSSRDEMIKLDTGYERGWLIIPLQI